MEPLWSPVVATVGNRRQIDGTSKSRKQAKTVASGCDRLPERFHGKEAVPGSSPGEGLITCKAAVFCDYRVPLDEGGARGSSRPEFRELLANRGSYPIH